MADVTPEMEAAAQAAIDEASKWPTRRERVMAMRRFLVSDINNARLIRTAALGQWADEYRQDMLDYFDDVERGNDG